MNALQQSMVDLEDFCARWSHTDREAAVVAECRDPRSAVGTRPEARKVLIALLSVDDDADTVVVRARYLPEGEDAVRERDRVYDLDRPVPAHLALACA